jgi:hypothetical protein
MRRAGEAEIDTPPSQAWASRTDRGRAQREKHRCLMKAHFYVKGDSLFAGF